MKRIGTKTKWFIIFIALIVFTIIAGFIGKLWYDIAWEAKNDRDTFHSYLTNDYASEDTVLATLTRADTIKFSDYTCEDFSNIGAIDVNIWYAEIDEYVRRKINGIPVDSEFNINIDTYQRKLKITLDKQSKKNVIKAVKTLSARSDIEEARPFMYTSVAQSISSRDYYYDKQWGLDNAKINNAWNIEEGSSSVIVGIIDSGIDASHPDLYNRIYRANTHTLSTTLHRDFTTDKTEGEPVLEPSDPYGHGTHVAGIIGAECNNIGIAGAARDVRFVSLRVLNEKGNITNNNALTNAIKYATKIGIPILNFSGCWYNELNQVQDAIKDYTGTFICAAGNFGDDNDGKYSVYPASYRLDNLISVGAIDKENERADFSNWGETTVDIFAPGVDIYSTFPRKLCDTVNCTTKLGTHIDYGYHSMDGTSMATPFVTGVAALMLSIDPQLTPQDLRQRLLSGGDAITIQTKSGDSMEVRKLNAYSAVGEVATYETNVLSDREIEITGTFGKPLYGQIDLPTTLNSRVVVAIGEEAFADQVGINNIMIIGYIQRIGAKAFYGCSALNRILLGSKVSEIGTRAFSYCDQLNFYVDSANKAFSDRLGVLYSYDGSEIVSAHNIPSEFNVYKYTTKIHPYAFEGNINLHSIRFNTNTEICDYAFANCINLSEMSYLASVTTPPSVGENALQGAKPIIYVPYTYIDDYKSAFGTYSHLIVSKSFPIRFIVNGVLTEERVSYYGDTVKNLPNVDLYGYHFGGWYDDPNFTGEPYSEGDLFEMDDILNLYCNLIPYDCTIVFNADGGIISEDNFIIVKYGEYVLTDITAKRTGYELGGWYDENGTICITSDGRSLFPWDRTETISLKAQWIKKSYEIQINANGSITWLSNDGISDEKCYIQYGTVISAINLIAIFKNSVQGFRTGKIFDHFEYKDSVLDWTSVPDLGENLTVITIIPVWINEVHTIYFKPLCDMDVAPVTAEYNATISLPSPSRLGYNFNGWYTAQTGGSLITWTTMPDLTPSSQSNGSTQLFARWTQIIYYIFYYPNGGSGYMDYTTHTYGVTAALRKNTFSKTYYDFAGWATSPNGRAVYSDGQDVLNLSYTSGDKIELYATWRAKNYNINYRNITSQMIVSPKYYTYGEGLSTMPVIRMKDSNGRYYTLEPFYGWYTSPEFATKVTSISATRTGDITVYAKYDYFLMATHDGATYTVKDKGVDNNPSKSLDVLLKSFYSEYLSNTTLKTLKIELSFKLWEINDGYQHIYLRNDATGKYLWSVKLDSASGEHTYSETIKIDLSEVKDTDTLTLLFDASGAFSDDWQFKDLACSIYLTN